MLPLSHSNGFVIRVWFSSLFFRFDDLRLLQRRFMRYDGKLKLVCILPLCQRIRR